VPTTRRERTRGLRGRANLEAGAAMWFPDATSVHTFGMRFEILVARLDAAMRVVDVGVRRPATIVMPSRRARHVLECRVDADVRLGDAFALAAPI